MHPNRTRPEPDELILLGAEEAGRRKGFGQGAAASLKTRIVESALDDRYLEGVADGAAQTLELLRPLFETIRLSRHGFENVANRIDESLRRNRRAYSCATDEWIEEVGRLLGEAALRRGEKR